MALPVEVESRQSMEGYLSSLGYPEILIPHVIENDTPQKAQEFVKGYLTYDNTGEDISIVRVLEEKRATCFNGTLLLLAMLYPHGYDPDLMLLLANKNDVHHNVSSYVVPETKLYGGVSFSSDPTIMDRPPRHETLDALSEDYYDLYLCPKPGHEGEKTMVAYVPRLKILERYGIDALFTDKGIKQIYNTYTEFLIAKTVIRKRELYGPYLPCPVDDGPWVVDGVEI